MDTPLCVAEEQGPGVLQGSLCSLTLCNRDQLVPKRDSEETEREKGKAMNFVQNHEKRPFAGCLVTSAWSADAGMRKDSPPVSPLIFFLSQSQGREWGGQLVSGMLGHVV